MRCGGGDDLVDEPDRSPLPRDCERITASDSGDIEGNELHVQPRPAGARRVRVEVACGTFGGRCRRRVVLRAGRTVLGRSRTAEFLADHRWLTVRLRRPLPRRGIVEVLIRGADEDPDGAQPAWYPYRFGYRLRR